MFTSHYSDRIVERNLIGLAPVLFVGLVLWLSRGAPGTLVERAAVALAGGRRARRVADRPLRGHHRDARRDDARAALQAREPDLAAERCAGSTSASRASRSPPWCSRRAAGCAGCRSCSRSRSSARRSRRAGSPSSRRAPSSARSSASTRTGSTAGRDARSPTCTTASRRGTASGRRSSGTTAIDRVYDLGREPVPGPLPQTPGEVQPDGTLFLPPSARQPGEWAVVSTWTTMVGEVRKEIKQVGLTQKGLRLWHVTPPMRVLDRISGLAVNGDVNAQDHARLDAYGCRDGVFRVTLIVKQPESIVDLRQRETGSPARVPVAEAAGVLARRVRRAGPPGRPLLAGGRADGADRDDRLRSSTAARS